MRKKELLLFDLDGTLFCGNSTYDFIEYIMHDNQKYKDFKRRYRVLKIYNKVCNLFFRYDWYKKKSIEFLGGYTEKELQEKAKEFYENKMSYARIEPMLNFLQCSINNSKLETGIITATIDIVAEEVKRSTGVDFVYATKLVYEEGVATGQYQKDLLHKKLALFEKELSLKYEKIYFFSDNAQDVKLLKRVAFGMKIYGKC